MHAVIIIINEKVPVPLFTLIIYILNYKKGTSILLIIVIKKAAAADRQQQQYEHSSRPCSAAAADSSAAVTAAAATEGSHCFRSYFWQPGRPNFVTTADMLRNFAENSGN